MKTTAIAFLISASAFAAVPIIDADSVSVKQDGSRTVVISYKLEPASAGDTEPAIITVDILTNGVSVGGSNLWTLTHDVNRIVTQGERKILWQPNEEKMPEFSLPAAKVTAKITAWSTNSPPNYWVIDLRTSDSMKDRLADRYYPNAEQIPLTVTNKLYKTERLVFRRIPAKGVTWKMGSPEGETKRNAYGTETQRYVTFSYDYWMSVFECSQGQEFNASIRDNAEFENSALPTANFTFNNLRMTDKNNNVLSDKYNWPSNGHENAGGYIAKWREALGGIMVDVPTSAEWEYACRAGTSTVYSFGDTIDNYKLYAWSRNQGGFASEVGLRLPNNWGLYDMHGNVQEWCMDWYTINIPATAVWDPTGPFQDDIDPLSAGTVSGTPNYNSYGLRQRVLRGGSFNNYLADGHFRSAANSRAPLALVNIPYTGYRLCIVMP